MTYYNILVVEYEKLVLGELQTNSYLVWNETTKEAVIIDPADDGTEIAQLIQEKQLKLNAILLTHGHFDHSLGALDLKLIFNVPIAVNSLDMFLLTRQQQTAEYFLKHAIVNPNIVNIDIDLNIVKEFLIGDEVLTIIHYPGHTPGGVGFYADKSRLLFSGDVIFAAGQTGSTNHSYSSQSQLKESIDNLCNLPKDTLVLPGHGEPFLISDVI